MAIEKILEEKEVIEKIVEVIPKTNKNRDYVAFPIEVLPKSFKKVKPKEKSFIRKVIKSMKILNLNKIYNEDIEMSLSFYLEDTSQNILEIYSLVIELLERIAFKSSKQIKKIKVEIKSL